MNRFIEVKCVVCGNTFEILGGVVVKDTCIPCERKALGINDIGSQAHQAALKQRWASIIEQNKG